MRILLLPFLLISVSLLHCSATEIKCSHPGYAGKTLDFYQYADPVTQNMHLLFSLEFDSDGNSSVTAPVKNTIYTFCDFGIYRGMLYLEPGKIIRLKLPPVREKSFADRKNPFFEPVSFWFLTEKDTDLNNQISYFTNQFNKLTDKYFNHLYFRQSKDALDSLTNILEAKLTSINDPAFDAHKNFTLKMVEVDMFRMKPESYSRYFSSVSPELWSFQSFISLFDKTFANQLSHKAKAISGDPLANAINRADMSYLLNHVKETYKIDGITAELALLKMLHDAYYSGDFSKQALQKLVNNRLFTNNPNMEMKNMALRVNAKFNFLKEGTEAPVICLKQYEGEDFCSDNKSAKFKYIVFADIEMIVCREHLKYLYNINERFQKHLETIIVLRDTEPDEINKFLAENEIPGIKLMDHGDVYSKEYKIRSYPQSFLLDKNHKVVYPAANNPMDGFEEQFGLFLQRELFERLRDQSR